MRILSLFAVIVIGSQFTATTVAQQRRHSNVLLIVVDDVGVDGLGVYKVGTDPPPTPFIDSLAAAGVTFRRAWSNPTCSPTRAGILTGQHAFRHGVFHPSMSDLSVQLADGRTRRTIPGMLPDNSTSALFGKWHLGTLADNGGTRAPNEHGFDYYAGNLEGHLARGYYSWTKTINGSSDTSTTYATKDVVDEAISWIADQSGKRWFAMLAFNAAHDPWDRDPPFGCSLLDTISTSRLQPYIDGYKKSIACLDSQIGRLINALDSQVLKNTTIILIGDNGVPVDVAEAPIRSSRAKGTLYQGGIRVPFIVSDGYYLVHPVDEWEALRIDRVGRVSKPGRRESALVHTIDLFATILEITGADFRPSMFDSVSLVPHLDSSSARPTRRFLYTDGWDADTGMREAAIRNQDYKLILTEKSDGTFDEEFYFLKDDPWEEDPLPLTGSDYNALKNEVTPYF